MAVAVSILVPALNERAHIGRALEAMLAQRLEGELEVLVIDGGSDDGTPSIVSAIAASDPRVRVFDNPARRTPQALNIGLREARGDYVARMDAHAIYPPDYLALGIERLAAGRADWVNGPQVPVGEGRWSKRIAAALRSPLGVGGASFRNATEEIEVDTGFTGMWTRPTLVELGGWDERWPINQDSELAGRMHERDMRVLCVPAMGAAYVPRDSLKRLGRQYFNYGKYRARTSRRHPHTLRRSHLLSPGLCLTTLGAAIPCRAVRRPATAGLALYAAAVLGASARVTRRERLPVADAAALPAVFVSMHVPWGVGFLAGCVRFGLPVAALRRLVTGGR